MNDHPIRIVKVGGSLLDIPDLPKRLLNWLASKEPSRNVLITGGGRFVDVLRQYDYSKPISEKASHWLAIDLMDIAAKMLGVWLPDIPVMDDLSNGLRVGQSVILLPGRFLREQEPDLPGITLPSSWEVTSDSIAARLAVVHGASELILLKSANPPIPSEDLNTLSKTGYVDAFFSRIAESIPSVRCENLRELEL